MILLTGATGTVGATLVDELLPIATAPVRALVRGTADAERLRRRGVDVAPGSFEDEAALERAMEGADRVFLLSPPGDAGMIAAQTRVVDAAARAGARHVVKVSSIAADEPTDARIVRAHRTIERHIEASGLAWTHLRPHWFLQNELGQAEAMVRDGRLHAPDVGRFTPVDARDVAAVAARVLAGGGHERRAYVLTGPEAVTYADIAAAFSTALGRQVEWVPVSLADARDAMLADGLPAELAEGFSEILGRYRQGGVASAVSPAVEDLLGRPPRSLERFVADHAGAFGPAPLVPA